MRQRVETAAAEGGGRKAEAATPERTPRDIKHNAQINYLLAKHQSISEI